MHTATQRQKHSKIGGWLSNGGQCIAHPAPRLEFPGEFNISVLSQIVGHVQPYTAEDSTEANTYVPCRGLTARLLIEVLWEASLCTCSDTAPAHRRAGRWAPALEPLLCRSWCCNGSDAIQRRCSGLGIVHDLAQGLQLSPARRIPQRSSASRAVVHTAVGRRAAFNA